MAKLFYAVVRFFTYIVGAFYLSDVYHFVHDHLHLPVLRVYSPLAIMNPQPRRERVIGGP